MNVRRLRQARLPQPLEVSRGEQTPGRPETLLPGGPRASSHTANRMFREVARTSPDGVQGRGRLAASIAKSIEVERGGGLPLPEALQADMERHFGTDLAAVRVHSGSRAEHLARSVHADAFATGTDIFIRGSVPNPESYRDRELMAHEVAHVVQHATRAVPSGSYISYPDDREEVIAREEGRAFAAAKRASSIVNSLRGASSAVATAPGATAIHRNEEDEETSSAVAPGTPAVRRRIIVIDGNVLDQINRGNQSVARTLLDLKESNHIIYVSHQAMREIVDGNPNPQMREAYRAMVTDLELMVAPPEYQGRLTDRVAHYERNIRSGALSEQDMLVAAQAGAGGAEIWSFDRSYRRNPGGVQATIRGLVIAPESTAVAPIGGRWDYAEGRRLLGLSPIVVAVDGSVTRVVEHQSFMQGMTSEGTTARTTTSDGRVIVATDVEERTLGVPTSSVHGVWTEEIDPMVFTAAVRQEIISRIREVEVDPDAAEELPQLRVDLARLESTADADVVRQIMGRHSITLDETPMRMTDGRRVEMTLDTGGYSHVTVEAEHASDESGDDRVTRTTRSRTVSGAGVRDSAETQTITTDTDLGVQETQSATRSWTGGLSGGSLTTGRAVRIDDTSGESFTTSREVTGGVHLGGGQLRGSRQVRHQADTTTVEGVTTSSESERQGSVSGVHGRSGSGLKVGAEASATGRTHGGLETSTRHSADGTYTVSVERISEDPPSYGITTTIHVGVGLGGAVRRHREAEARGVDASASVSGSANTELVYTRVLDEVEARQYLGDLDSVRSGSSREGQPEFGLLARIRGAATILEAEVLAVGSAESALAMSEGETMELRGSVGGDLSLGAGGSSGGMARTRRMAGMSASVGTSRSRVIAVRRSGDHVDVTITVAAEERASGSVTARYGVASVTGGLSGRDGSSIAVTFRIPRENEAEFRRYFSGIVALDAAESLTAYADAHESLVHARSDGRSGERGRTVSGSLGPLGATIGSISSRSEEISVSEGRPTGTLYGQEAISGAWTVADIRVLGESSASGVSATVSASDNDPTQAELDVTLTHTESSSDWADSAREIARRFTERRVEDSVAEVAAEGPSAIIREMLEAMTSRITAHDLTDEEVAEVVSRARDQQTWDRATSARRVLDAWAALRTALISPHPRREWAEDDTTDDDRFARRLAQADALVTFMEVHGESGGRDAIVWVLRNWGGGTGFDLRISTSEDIGLLSEWPPSLAETRIRYDRLRDEVDGLNRRLEGIGGSSGRGMSAEGQRVAGRIRDGLISVQREIEACTEFELPRAKLEMIGEVQAQIRLVDRRVRRFEAGIAGAISAPREDAEQAPTALRAEREAERSRLEEEAQASLPEEDIPVNQETILRLNDALDALRVAKTIERDGFAQARSLLPQSAGGTLRDEGWGGFVDVFRGDWQEAVHLMSRQSDLVEGWIRQIREVRDLYRAAGRQEDDWQVKPDASSEPRALDPDIETMCRLYEGAHEQNYVARALGSQRITNQWRQWQRY